MNQIDLVYSHVLQDSGKLSPSAGRCQKKMITVLNQAGLNAPSSPGGSGFALHLNLTTISQILVVNSTPQFWVKTIHFFWLPCPIEAVRSQKMTVAF